MKNLLYHDATPRNRRRLRTFLGASIVFMDSTMSGSVVIPPDDTKCSRYRIDRRSNLYFSGFNFGFAVLNRFNTSLTWFRCSSIILSIKRWKVAAECCPNGITVNWNSPLDGTVKAVMGLQAEDHGTCKYPCWRSILDVYRALWSLSRIALTYGSRLIPLPNILSTSSISCVFRF